MAKTLDGFYQESGRGGRDGKPSVSVLYYSKDDAEKFAYLIKMNAEREAKKKGKHGSQQIDHSLVELEGMVSYCTKPICKRLFVLAHFGEKIDAQEVCAKTCDYCRDPERVERDIRASECMSTVVNSHKMMHNAGKREAKKYHHNPLADEESVEGDYGTDDFFGSDDGHLGITGRLREDEMPSNSMPKTGFVKASSVLSKYETLECQQGKKNGFVNFKTRTFDEPTQEDMDAKRNRVINVPQHMRRGLPDPLAAQKKAPEKEKSSTAYASEADKLKAELEELQKQKAAMLAKMGGSVKGLSSRSSKPLPAPSLSFKKRH